MALVAGNMRGGVFSTPPLKRLHPWETDGHGGTDLVVGGIGKDGTFKGMVMSGAHIQSIIRTFQLARSHMPDGTGLGDDLANGCPILIITRGCYGRELDLAPGPVRNASSGAVWGAAKEARQMNPSLQITCVDAPIYLSNEQIAAVFEPPLNQYRELAYYHGTWYVPDVQPMPDLAKQMRENQRKPLFRVDPGEKNKQKFDRKKFAWNDPDKDLEYSVDTWKPVLATGFEAEPPAPVRGAPLPVESAIVEAKPELALARAEKMFVKHQDPAVLLRAAGARLGKPQISDAGLREALKAASKAVTLYREQEDKKGEASALATVARVQYARKENAEALTAAAEFRAACQEEGDWEMEMEAVLMIVNLHFAQNDKAEAMKTATEAREHFQEAAEEDAELLCLQLVVSGHLAEKEHAEALQVASDARERYQSAKSAKGERDALRLMVNVHMANKELDEALKVANEGREHFKKVKDQESEASVCLLAASVYGAKEENAEAIAAQKEAKTLYHELKDSKKEMDALQGLYNSHLTLEEPDEALEVAKELQALAEKEENKLMDAYSYQLMATARLQMLKVPDAQKDGRAEELLLENAEKAVELFEELGDVSGQASAKQILAMVKLGSNDHAEALAAAQQAKALFREIGGAEGLESTLITSAQAHFAKGHLFSAMWDAQQALYLSLTASPHIQRIAQGIIEDVQAVDYRVRVGPEIVTQSMIHT